MIKSIEELISEVKKDYSSWNTTTQPWFRGELCDTKWPLVPKLYRPKSDCTYYRENQLLQQFRMKAPSLGYSNTPPRNHTDEWLFLAQHVGLPTRLLDWTEGLFLALYFALLEDDPVIWMLDPIELNRCTVPEQTDNVFPLTWHSFHTTPANQRHIYELAQLIKTTGKITEKEPKDHYFHKGIYENLGVANIRGAWELDRIGTMLPVAILPTYSHPRMNSQKSCFTIQGKVKESLSKLVSDRVLKKYVINKEYIHSFRNDLRMLGITHTSVFQDLDHLSRDLKEIF